MNGFTLELFTALAVAGFVSALAIIPYSMVFMRLKMSHLQIPPERIAVLSATQAGVLAVAGTAAGLVFAGWAGLGAPNIDRLISGEPIPSEFQSELSIAAALGFATAILAVILERFVFWNYLPEQFHERIPSAVWKRLLATLYGGVTEEIIVRLLFLSLFAWALSHISSKSNGLPTDSAMWTAIALAAVVFGLLHLPATLALAPLTRVVVVRTLLLNGVVGIAAGWVYWQYGLLAAMATHWCADLVIILIAPSIILKSSDSSSD